MAQNASLLRNVDWNNRTDGCLCTQTCVLFLHLHPGHGAVLAGDHGMQEGVCRLIALAQEGKK